MSITHNKNLRSLSNLLINCISARSSPQTLSIKGECTFLLLNFVVIGFCNSPSNSLLEIFLFLVGYFFPLAKTSDHASVASRSDVFLSNYL